jgi:hypothetical protein
MADLIEATVKNSKKGSAMTVRAKMAFAVVASPDK